MIRIRVKENDYAGMVWDETTPENLLEAVDFLGEYEVYAWIEIDGHWVDVEYLGDPTKEWAEKMIKEIKECEGEKLNENIQK